MSFSLRMVCIDISRWGALFFFPSRCCSPPPPSNAIFSFRRDAIFLHTLTAESKRREIHLQSVMVFEFIYTAEMVIDLLIK